MYYLRLEPQKKMASEIRFTNGKPSIPAHEYMTEDRTIYKHHDFSRFYRSAFNGLDYRYDSMKVYTCKTLKTILALRKSTFEYCGEMFDVYDENGKVELPTE